MENTATPQTTDNINKGVTGRVRVAGEDVPRNMRVSRCTSCEGGRFAVAWKGSARPACPNCGGQMTTTTRHLKAGFVVLEGEVLAQAERLAGGLLADVNYNLEDAGRMVANLVRDLERVAGGSAELELSTASQWSAGGLRIRAGYSSSGRIVAILEAATKAEAKAAKYERRLARIGGAIESPAVTKALEVIEARRQRLADERVKVLELLLNARELVEDDAIAAELLEAIRGLDTGKAEAIEEGEARVEVERRGLPPVAGGSNELDEEIVALRGELAGRIDTKRADVARLSKVRTFIAGKAAAAARVELELLEEWLEEAGKRAGRGDVRTAVLALKGGLGDKAARRACQHYGTDAMLEAAEALSAAQDYTDGGGPVDEAGARLFDD